MNPIVRSLFAAVAVVFAASCLVVAKGHAAERLADPKMAGHWTGTAEIVVNWTKQRQLSVDIVIANDGTATGRVGDATLSGASLMRNRGWFGRTLHLATDWIIIGDLTGDIVAAEAVHRTGVKMPLTWGDDRFTGAIHTSGSLFGGKDAMILSAGRMTLRRKD